MNLDQLSIDFEEEEPEKVVDKMQQEAHGPKFATIFSGPQVTGDALKTEGMDKTLSKEQSKLYRDKLTDTLKVFPVRTRITIEQLTGIVGRPPEGVSNNAIGAAVNSMAKKGLIRETGRRIKAGRKERHSGDVREWEVVKYA